jgi:hypothetical protein
MNAMRQTQETIILIAQLICIGITTHAQITFLSDSFDSYSLGVFGNLDNGGLGGV